MQGNLYVQTTYETLNHMLLHPFQLNNCDYTTGKTLSGKLTIKNQLTMAKESDYLHQGKGDSDFIICSEMVRFQMCPHFCV